MMKRRVSGVCLKSRLVMMELMQTLLPLPVAPATRRCGIAARSAMIAWPYTSLPSANGNAALEDSQASLSKSSRIPTFTLLELAISMPTVSLPGIGARILILSARVARARSDSYFVISFTLTPVAG